MRSVSKTFNDNEIVYDAMFIFPSISLKKPTPGTAEIIIDAIARDVNTGQLYRWIGVRGSNVPNEAINIITGRAIIV